jgi:hypothetical protein
MGRATWISAAPQPMLKTPILECGQGGLRRRNLPTVGHSDNVLSSNQDTSLVGHEQSGRISRRH